MKLFDSERRVMEVLWQRGEESAKGIAQALGAQVGWSKTTTYTVIQKCIAKGAASRSDPGFRVRPLITREQVRDGETDELIDKHYGGSPDLLVASLLSRNALGQAEIDRLRTLVERANTRR